jgi:hypothetical protein
VFQYLLSSGLNFTYDTTFNNITPLPAFKTYRYLALQPGLLIPLRIPNPNNRLAPSPPLLQIIQPLSDLLEPIVHLVKDGRDEFPLAEQSHEFSPDVELLVGFVLCGRQVYNIISACNQSHVNEQRAR